MGVTEQKLAEFIAEYPAERIPPEIMHLGKRLLMNELAVALHASTDPAIGILLDLFRLEGGRRLATVFGTGVRTSLLNAALANGFLGHFDDYDDTHMTAGLHPSSPILPAPLALSEMMGLSGARLLAASVLGIEVACRIGEVITPHQRETTEWWHPTNTFGVFGAAAAAARLLGLTPSQNEHALGLAGTQAMGLREVSGTLGKPFHAGKAAQNGLLAALLAQRGFTSISAESKGIFEARRGFIAIMAKDYDLSLLCERLGENWELPMVGIKAYSCGIVNHALVDSTLALRKKPGVTPDTVESIQVRVPRISGSFETRRHPQKGLEGKFSYHHSVAVSLVHGKAYPAQFTDAVVNDPLIRSVRDRIEVEADPSIGHHGGAVAMTLKDGRSYSVATDHALGTPQNPMSDGQVEEKFRVLAAEVLPKENIDRLVDRLWQVEKLRSVRQLTTLLSPAPKGG